jgi:hypothetical protein
LKSSQTTAAYWENYEPRRGSGLASNPRKPRNQPLEEVSKVIDDVSEATTDVSEVTDDHREVTPMAFEATADDHKSHRQHTKRSRRAMEVADGQVDAGGGYVSADRRRRDECHHRHGRARRFIEARTICSAARHRHAIAL